MSTRSRVAIVNEDGSVESIYVHFDGYKEGVGAVLKKHYVNRKKIKELLELGDISVLGKEYDEELSKLSWEKYSLSEDEKAKHKDDLEKLDNGSYTIAYKDRGEKDITKRVDDSMVEFRREIGSCGEEFTYIFENDYDGVDKWFVIETPYPEEL